VIEIEIELKLGFAWLCLALLCFAWPLLGLCLAFAWLFLGLLSLKQDQRAGSDRP
jgi:hypothetical protein